jgi:dTDP-4-amino-4,6-dideoxygalactose transaminase
MKIPSQRINIPEESRKTIHKKLDKLFQSGQFAYGKYVAEFEKQFAKFIGKKFAVAMNSCTTSLEVAIRAIYKQGRAIVVVPANSYMASANAVINAGHTVKFCDVGENLMLDVGELEKIIDGVSGVMLVHIGGNVHPQTVMIREMCEKRGIPLIEDAAHSHGSTLKHKKAGSFGHVSCFSFYPTKIMSVCGEGGMLLTDDGDIAEFARRYRHHGRMEDPENPQNYTHIQDGSNYCMDEIRAVIGLSQLSNLPGFIAHRRQIANIYDEKFHSIMQPTANFYKYITYDRLQVKNKDISLSGPVYRVPLHLQPRTFEGVGKYPNAEKYCQAHSCIPIFSDMTIEESQFVMDNIEVIKLEVTKC